MSDTIKQLKYGEDSDGEFYIEEVDNPDTQVAYVVNCGDFNKTLALARLFAAAPELLEALAALLDMNDNYSYFGGEIYRDRIDRAWDNARAALAKARGEKRLAKPEHETLTNKLKCMAMQDLAYINGVKAGWNAGIAEDQEKYTELIRGRSHALSTLKADWSKE